MRPISLDKVAVCPLTIVSLFGETCAGESHEAHGVESVSDL